MSKREIVSSYEREEKQGNKNKRKRSACKKQISSEILEGAGEAFALFLLRTFSPSNERRAVINTCVYLSTLFAIVSALHLCLEKHPPPPWSLNFSPCVYVRIVSYIFGITVLDWQTDTFTDTFMKCVLGGEKFSSSFLLEGTWICVS